MNAIAICAGSTVIYWSGMIIALGIAAGFALTYSLYTSYVGTGRPLWVLLPAAVFFSVVFCRLLHWYCHMEQYTSLLNALTDYSGGGYCLPGAVLGVLTAAYLTGRLGFTGNAARMLDAAAPGAALCAAFIRLSALFNSSCRGKIVITRPALQHLPLASPVYTGGAAEYRFAAFFVEFLVLLAVSAALLRFYFSRRSIEMRGRESSDGHTARMLLLLFSAVEFIFDSTRYDSSFMHLNGFVSIVQVFSAASMLALLIYYSRMSVRVSGRSGRRAGLWIGWGVSLVCAALAEYLVQRHGDWYGRCYLLMFTGLAGMTAAVYAMYLGCCAQPEREE